MAQRTDMTLVAFMQAQNCSNYVGSWRHPSSMSDFLTPAYYQRIARTLEAAKFQMAFFDDRLALPDIYGDDHREAVAHGARAVKLDPTVVLMAMAAATSKLGLGATYSTTYYEPFHVARLFGTLDLMTEGRVAWNVVTSLNNSEAANFGREEHLEHDLRYDRADEFLEVVTALWSSWDDDALIVDKDSGRFADPQKVHRLDHHGAFFRSKGPLPVPRSPQGQPVLLQAGQSGRGVAFAARWAELVFASYPSLEAGQKQYASLKAAAAAMNRDPNQVKILPSVKVIVGETASIAKEKFDLADSMAKPIDSLTLLCEVLNVDFAKRPYDQPFTDAELAAVSWHSLRDKVIAKSGKKNPSVRDFVEFSGRGTLREGPVFVGTARQVADEMQAWFESACDGFVLSATTIPGTYEDIARLLVPELQRRGVFQTEYKGSTLRANLGLPKSVARTTHPAKPVSTAA